MALKTQGNRIVDQKQVLKIWENYVTELYDRPNRLETLEVEPEDEVDTDENGPYILQSEVEKAIKEMRDRKATGDDDVPEDVLKLLGEGGLKILTKLINTIYETRQWPKDSTEVSMIALKKKTQTTKCSDNCTISRISHTAKIIAKILRRRIESKIEDVRRLFFFQPPIVLLRKYEIRGSQICASRDCAAPPPQPLLLSAPMHQS